MPVLPPQNSIVSHCSRLIPFIRQSFFLSNQVYIRPDTHCDFRRIIFTWKMLVSYSRFYTHLDGYNSTHSPTSIVRAVDSRPFYSSTSLQERSRNKNRKQKLKQKHVSTYRDKKTRSKKYSFLTSDENLEVSLITRLYRAVFNKV